MSTVRKVIFIRDHITDDIIFCKSLRDMAEKLEKLYIEQDVCFEEFIDGYEINGLSISQSVGMYAQLADMLERDRVVRKTEEGEEFDLKENILELILN